MTTPAGPRSGDDTHDLIDDALYQLAERRHKWLGDPTPQSPTAGGPTTTEPAANHAT